MHHTATTTKRPLTSLCSMQRAFVVWAVAQGGGERS